MKLPNEVVEAMNQFASSYSPAQKAWFDRNIGYVISKVRYIDTNDEEDCSCYSPQSNRICVTSHNRGVEQTADRLTETVWHEYGHLIYENAYVGGFQNRLVKELTPYITKYHDNGELNLYIIWFYIIGSSENCPAMVSDAIGIIEGIELPYYRCHEVGYPIEDLETEIFAEYFAYVMTNNTKMLAKFEEMCPKTAHILNKQIYRLFK